MIPLYKHDLNDIGFGLMATLIKSQKKILIAEDLEFLENYLRLTSSQCDRNFQSFLACKLKSFSLFTSGFVTFLCATLLRQTPLLSDPSSYITTACVFLSFLDIGFFISVSLKKWMLQRMFIAMCDDLDSNMQNLKDLYNLILEFEVMEQRVESFFNKSSQLRTSAFTQCKDIFGILRAATLKARKLPTAFSDVETDDSYISSIPFEAFDELMANECLRTNSQLKSLVQLIKLQQSEFVRRLICVLNPLSVADSYQLIDRITELVTELRNKLEPYFNKIRMMVVLFRSCWLNTDKKSRPSVNPLTAELVASVKQSRIYLQSAMVHLFDADSFLHQEGKNSSCEKNVMDKFESALKEIKVCCDFINSILRKYSYRPENTRLASSSVPVTPTVSQSQNVIVTENFTPMVEDQVFMASSVDQERIETDETDEKFAALEKATMPSVLYEELKFALIPKAKEHQEREAKSLGVSIDEVPIQLGEGAKPLVPEPSSVKASSAEERFLPLRQFNLSELIASSAPRQKNFFSLGNEEQFGDNADEED